MGDDSAAIRAAYPLATADDVQKLERFVRWWYEDRWLVCALCDAATPGATIGDISHRRGQMLAHLRDAHGLTPPMEGRNG